MKLNQWQREILKLEQISDKDMNRKLYNAYNDALKDVRKRLKTYMDEHEDLPYYKQQQAGKLSALEKEIVELLNGAYPKAKHEVTDFKRNEMMDGYYSSMYQIEAETGARLDFLGLDTEFVRQTVANPIAGKTLSKRLYTSREKLATRATSELRTGMMQGKAYAEIAGSISRHTEANYKQAVRIARTEGGRLRSLAKQEALSEAKNLGIDLKKVWYSSLDNRTRSSHRLLDGQTVEVDDDFVSPESGAKGPMPRMLGKASEDIGCRCTSLTEVDGIKPGTRVDSFGDTSSYGTYEEWKNRPEVIEKMQDKTYKDYVDALGRKYKTKEFEKLLDQISEREYKHLSKLEKAKIPDSNQRLKIDGKEIMGKTNMLETFGEKNYSAFTEHLANVSDERIARLYEKHGSDLVFEKVAEGKERYSGQVFLSQSSFNGNSAYKPLEMIYHENAHAMDRMGVKSITGEKNFKTGNRTKVKGYKGKVFEVDEEITLASALPQYNLKQTIHDDLWNYVNGDLPTYDSLGKVPRKKAERELYDKMRSDVYNQNKANMTNFKEKMLKLSEEKPYVIHGLSDIVESTGYLGEYPFGFGHGKNYWKTAGMAETEFFAHASESVATNPESYQFLQEIFPNAFKTWETIVDDMIKGVD